MKDRSEIERVTRDRWTLRSEPEIGRNEHPGFRIVRSGRVKALLGSKYDKGQEYRKELPTRRIVKNLTAALDAAGTPLSEERADS